MKENKKNFMDIFIKMDDEKYKLEGLASMLFAVEEALLYGSGDPKEYTSAICLISRMLDDYNKSHKELINEGHQIMKSENLKNVE